MKKYCFFFIALVLLLASAGKLWLLLTSPFADVVSGYPISILWFSTVVEFLLGVWILKSHSSSMVWLACTALFAVFFALSLGRMIFGYRECGCAGIIELPTWSFLLIDGVVLSFLVMVAPRSFGGIRGALASARGEFAGLDSSTRGRMLAVVATGIVAVLLPLEQFNGIRTLVVGDPPVVATLNAPDSVDSTTRSFMDLRIVNGSSSPARIVGVDQSCRCLGMYDSLELVPAHSEATVRIRIDPRKKGQFNERMICYLDHPNQMKIVIPVRVEAL